MDAFARRYIFRGTKINHGILPRPLLLFGSTLLDCFHVFFILSLLLLNPSSWLLVFPLRALDLHYRILPVLFHVMQICLHFSISSRLLFMLATFRRLSLHSHSPYKFYTCLRLLASSILLFTLPPVPPSHDSPTRHGCWV